MVFLVTVQPASDREDKEVQCMRHPVRLPVLGFNFSRVSQSAGTDGNGTGQTGRPMILKPKTLCCRLLLPSRWQVNGRS